MCVYMIKDVLVILWPYPIQSVRAGLNRCCYRNFLSTEFVLDMLSLNYKTNPHSLIALQHVKYCTYAESNEMCL